jgi:hypothetical protein
MRPEGGELALLEWESLDPASAQPEGRELVPLERQPLDPGSAWPDEEAAQRAV